MAESLKGKLFSFPAYETPYGKLIKSHLHTEWRADLERTSAPEEDQIKESGHIDAMAFQAMMLANKMELASEIEYYRKNPYPNHVVLDRYWPSAYVYGSLDGLDRGLLLKMHQPLPQPELFILLDVDAKMSTERRPERRDRYEKQEGLMAQLVDRYCELWEQMQQVNSRAWEVVDGRGPIEQVSAAILAVVKERM